jgi:hypothetical protein
MMQPDANDAKKWNFMAIIASYAGIESELTLSNNNVPIINIGGKFKQHLILNNFTVINYLRKFG